MMTMIEKEKVKLQKLIDLCNLLQGDTVEYINYNVDKKIPQDKLAKLREAAQVNNLYKYIYHLFVDNNLSHNFY